MYEFIKRMYLTDIYNEEDIRFLGEGGLLSPEEVEAILASKPAA